MNAVVIDLALIISEEWTAFPISRWISPLQLRCSWGGNNGSYGLCGNSSLNLVDCVDWKLLYGRFGKLSSFTPRFNILATHTFIYCWKDDADKELRKLAGE